MKKVNLFLMVFITILLPSMSNAKTLIVYYSYTNNSHLIATELQHQTDADILRVEPTEENVNYNDYSIGLTMMNTIKNYPNDEASYPIIKTTIDNLNEYDTILIVAPLWWNAMAAPLQTFFFHYGSKMENKNIGLIVSSGESLISGVVADVHRLIPKGKMFEPSLWIIRDKTSECAEMIKQWLKDIKYYDIASIGEINEANLTELASIEIMNSQITVNGEFDILSIYSSSGQLIKTSTKSPTSIASFSDGLYLVSLTSNGKNHTTKVLLKK